MCGTLIHDYNEIKAIEKKFKFNGVNIFQTK